MPEPKLNEGHIIKISARLVTNLDMRKLAFHLDIETYIVEASLKNNKGNLQEASFQILWEWYKRQSDKIEAYRRMWEGLTQKNLFLIANEVLKVKPEKDKAGHFDEEGKKKVYGSAWIIRSWLK